MAGNVATNRDRIINHNADDNQPQIYRCRQELEEHRRTHTSINPLRFTITVASKRSLVRRQRSFPDKPALTVCKLHLDNPSARAIYLTSLPAYPSPPAKLPALALRTRSLLSALPALLRPAARASPSLERLMTVCVLLLPATAAAFGPRRAGCGVIESFGAFAHDAASDEALQQPQFAVIFRRDKADGIAHGVGASRAPVVFAGSKRHAMCRRKMVQF